jgi:hypothetical protein
MLNCEAPNCPVLKLETTVNTIDGKLDRVCEQLGGQAVISARLDDLRDQITKAENSHAHNFNEIFTRFRANEEKLADKIGRSEMIGVITVVILATTLFATLIPMIFKTVVK